MSAGDRGTLAALLAKAIAGQREHERYDAPYVHDWGTRQDYRNRDRAVRTVQVDGDLDLSALADVLLASDWLAGVRADEVREAAAAIQALHPGEVKASVEFLKERASFIDGTGHIDLDYRLDQRSHELDDQPHRAEGEEDVLDDHVISSHTSDGSL